MKSSTACKDFAREDLRANLYDVIDIAPSLLYLARDFTTNAFYLFFIFHFHFVLASRFFFLFVVLRLFLDENQ